MISRNMRQFLPRPAVIPTHKDLFGSEATLEELIGLLKKHPVAEWLSHLSRMQNMLAGEHAGEPERIRAVLCGTASAVVRKKWEESARRYSGTPLLYYERQMSTLQQLAILHAPESGTTMLDNEEGRHDLSIALFMTMDIMGADRPLGGAAGSVLPVVIQDQIRMSTTSAQEYAARAFHFYELGRGQQNAEVSQYLELFQIAAGVNAVDCILGGLDIVAREETRTIHDTANAWYGVPRPDRAENPRETVVLDAYQRIRMKQLADLRVLIRERDGDQPVRDWNLIALSQAPICDLGDLGAFVLNHTVLGRSLFDSVRHVILTAAREKRLPKRFDNPQAIGALYGGVFESYIRSIFECAYPAQVWRIPEDRTKQRADFLIWFPDKVLIIEVKGVHFVGQNHASFLSIHQRRAELEKIGIPHAIDQLASTISALRRGDIVVPSMPSYDWTVTPIIPVIVTEEHMPQTPGCWDAFYGPLCAKLDGSTAAGPLGKLRLLTIRDVEGLPGLQAPRDLATMLYRWGADQNLLEWPWSSFLATQRVSSHNSFMAGRFVDVLRLLARQLGLDETKFAVSPTK